MPLGGSGCHFLSDQRLHSSQSPATAEAGWWEGVIGTQDPPGLAGGGKGTVLYMPMQSQCLPQAAHSRCSTLGVLG